MKRVTNKVKNGLEPKRFARKAEVLSQWFPASPATLYRRIKDGSFPAAIRISPGISAWDIDQLEAWVLTQREGQ
jgi:prophage regulatory protein